MSFNTNGEIPFFVFLVTKVLLPVLELIIEYFGSAFSIFFPLKIVLIIMEESISNQTL
jgi:hypothetical protein